MLRWHMRMRWLKSRHYEDQAWWLFKKRFLRDAESPDTQQQIDGQLAEKVAQLPQSKRAKASCAG